MCAASHELENDGYALSSTKAVFDSDANFTWSLTPSHQRPFLEEVPCSSMCSLLDSLLLDVKEHLERRDINRGDFWIWEENKKGPFQKFLR